MGVFKEAEEFQNQQEETWVGEEKEGKEANPFCLFVSVYESANGIFTFAV